MVDILHRVGVEADADDVSRVLTTPQGLAGWWTTDTTGDGEPGGVLRFRFGTDGLDAKVLDAEAGRLVLWEVIDGPEEWVGTRIRFDLSAEDGMTIVRFRHEGWREPVEFMYHCSTKWAVFLLSLKRLLETGTGNPAPDDVRIGNWS